MKQNKPMNQIDKLKEEFDKEFGPKTIWVVPSKENIETIKDIWSWIIQNFTPKEEMEKLLERVSDIANLIKETRKELGESQTVFGARFGLPHHSISYYENGHYEAPYSVIKFCIRQSLNKLKEQLK